MAVWLVLDMDDGVRGAFTSMAAAVNEFIGDCPRERTCYRPGVYDYRWWYPGDRSDGDSFFLERLGADPAGGWEWAIEAWEKAGRPMGRFPEAIPGRED